MQSAVERVDLNPLDCERESWSALRSRPSTYGWRIAITHEFNCLNAYR